MFTPTLLSCSCTINVEGQTFEVLNRNKKVAKGQVATKALESLQEQGALEKRVQYVEARK